jgi:hypothetical protein
LYVLYFFLKKALLGWLCCILALGHKEEEDTSLLRTSSLMHHAVWDWDVVNVESDERGTRLVRGVHSV